MPADSSKVNREAPTTTQVMARPGGWFRFYHEFVDDPKVREMTVQNRYRLVGLFCLQCKGILTLLSESEIACALECSTKALRATKKVFIEKGFIDEEWNVIHWEKRQCMETDAARRMRESRERRRNRCATVAQPLQGSDASVAQPLRHGDVTVLAGARSPSDGERDSEEIPSTPHYQPVLDNALDPASNSAPREENACTHKNEPTTPAAMRPGLMDEQRMLEAKRAARHAGMNGVA